MELFGIEIRDSVSSDGSQYLFQALRRWGVDGAGATGMLVVSLVPSPSAKILVSPWSRSDTQDAAGVVSRALRIPLFKPWADSPRDQIVVGISGGAQEMDQILEDLAWAIFLWAAHRYPKHPAWNVLFTKPEQLVRKEVLVPTQGAPTVASFASQSLPLPRKRHDPAASALTPTLHPPAAAPGPRRGG